MKRLHVLYLSPWKFTVLLVNINDLETWKKICYWSVKSNNMLSLMLKLNNTMIQIDFISDSQKAELKPP